jgi:hypothetical protein
MSTLARSIESAAIKAAIPEIIQHPAFFPGTGLRAQTIQTIVKQHRKVLIFTSPVMRTRIADEAAKAGIPVTNLVASILTADKIEAVEAFENAEEGVLVASPYSATGWRADAKCIVLCELLMPRSNAYLYRMVTRARASELHLVNCHFPSSVVTDLVQFFEGHPRFLDEIESEPTTPQ